MYCCKIHEISMFLKSVVLITKLISSVIFKTSLKFFCEACNVVCSFKNNAMYKYK